MERKTSAKARLSRPEKRMLVALVDELKDKSRRFRDRLRGCVLLVGDPAEMASQPGTPKVDVPASKRRRTSPARG